MNTDNTTTSPPDMADHPGTLRIEGSLTVQTAEEIRAQLLALLRQPGEVAIDLNAVDVCDCAGLELLCSARKSAANAGRSLRMDGLSRAVQDASKDIGLETSAFANASHES